MSSDCILIVLYVVVAFVFACVPFRREMKRFLYIRIALSLFSWKIDGLEAIDDRHAAHRFIRTNRPICVVLQILVIDRCALAKNLLEEKTSSSKISLKRTQRESIQPYVGYCLPIGVCSAQSCIVAARERMDRVR